MITRWHLVLAMVWLVVAVAAWAMLWPAQQAALGPAFATDFHKFLLSVQRFTELGGLFAPTDSGEAGALLHGNLNPPPFSLPVLAIAPLGFADGLRLWQWLSLAGALASVPLAWRLAGPLRNVNGMLYALALGLALVSGFPGLVVYNIGQVTFLLLPFLLLALLAVLSGREVSGGVLLGAMCLLKPLFALLVLLLLLRGAWRVAAGAAAGGAAMLLAGASVFGTGAYLDYLAVLGGVDWHGVSWNASLLGLLDRISGGGLDAADYAVHAAAALALIAALVLLARRQPDRARDLRLVLAGGLPLILLLSPLGWMYYWPWCVPAAALMLPALRDANRAGFAWWLLLPAVGALRVAPLAPLPTEADWLAIACTWSFYLLQTAALLALVAAAGLATGSRHASTDV